MGAPGETTAGRAAAERPKTESARPAVPAVLWLSAAWLNGADEAECEVLFPAWAGRLDQHHRGSLHDLVQWVGDQPFAWTVILPAHCVSLTSVQAPPANLDLFLQSLPYALEEQLASDVETLHVATAAPDADGCIDVAIVARDLVSTTLHRLAAQSISPVAMFAELQLVPGNEQHGTAVLTDTGILYRRGAERLLLDAEDLESCLPIIRAGGKVALVTPAGSAEARKVGEHLKASGVEIADTLSAENLRHWQWQRIEAIAPVNLLQGVFAPVDPTERWKSILRWGFAAVVTIIMLQCGYWLGAGIYFHREAQSAQAEAETVYRGLFPAEKRVVNVRTQLQAHLDAQTADRGRLAFAQFMNHFSGAWRNAAMGDSLVKNISFDGEKRVALVQVLSPSVSITEPLLKAIAANGIRAKVVSVSKQDERDLVRLQLEWR